MKLRPLFSFLIAGSALMASAQSHVEGMEYYKADQPENAKELLERNFNSPQTDKALANYYLGMIAFDKGDLKTAQKYFEAGQAADPENGYNYVGLGAVLLKDGDVKGAEKFFKDGEGKAKKDAALQVQIAQAYYDVNPAEYSAQIEKRLEKARKINMQEPAIYIFEGDRKKANKDVGGAAASYEMGANYGGTTPEAYVKYANLYNNINPGYAVVMLEKLTQVNPTSALGQKELAEALYNKGDFTKAAEQYGKYVKNPNHFKKDEDRYAFLLFYGQKYQDGYDYSTNLLKADPNNFNARRFQFIYAAQIPALEGQLPAMADALYAAKKKNPANKFAQIDYSLLSEEFVKTAKANKERPVKAIDLLQEAIAESPENPAYYKSLAMVLVDDNDLPNAADTYMGFLQNTPEPGYNDFIQQATFDYYAGVQYKNDDPDHNRTADPAQVEKYFKLAEDFINRAAQILPDNYRPVKMRGDIAMQRATSETDVKKAAQPLYEQAVVLLEQSADPSRYATDAKTMYNYLGNYYLDQKDTAKAKEYFNKYLQYDPNNEGYRKFVEGLK